MRELTRKIKSNQQILSLSYMQGIYPQASSTQMWSPDGGNCTSRELVKMQNGPHPRFTESESLGIQSRNLYFNMLFR